MKITAFADPRLAVRTIASRRGTALTALSRLLGRSHDYIPRFVRVGVPKALQPNDRAVLARFLGADERDLGATS